MVSGCTYYTSGNKLSPISPPLPAFQPVIEHAVGGFSMSQETGKLISPEEAGKQLNERIFDDWKQRQYIQTEEFVESGVFSGTADYHLILSGSERIASNLGLRLLSAVTLSLLPATTKTDYDLHYTLVDIKSGKKYKATVQESSQSYSGLFFIFASPFSEGNQKEMFDRISDHLYNQFYLQGAFQNPK